MMLVWLIMMKKGMKTKRNFKSDCQTANGCLYTLGEVTASSSVLHLFVTL